VEQLGRLVILETDRYRITGLLHMPRDGYRSRLTDYLNGSDREFLALTEVELAPLQGPPSAAKRYPFVALAARHVVLAIPADETGDSVASESAESPTFS
jgi:hypothetical protein